MLCACIYFSGKINEDFKRLRDIINTYLFVKTKYEHLRNAVNYEKEYIANLKNDDYLKDDGFTLINTIANLSLDNVVIHLIIVLYN
jgi:hypothetical protein